MPVSKISWLKKLESMAHWVSLVCFILGLQRGIQMHHGWSPHDGMRAPICGALMMAWGLQYLEPSWRQDMKFFQFVVYLFTCLHVWCLSCFTTPLPSPHHHQTTTCYTAGVISCNKSMLLVCSLIHLVTCSLVHMFTCSRVYLFISSLFHFLPSSSSTSTSVVRWLCVNFVKSSTHTPPTHPGY